MMDGRVGVLLTLLAHPVYSANESPCLTALKLSMVFIILILAVPMLFITKYALVPQLFLALLMTIAAVFLLKDEEEITKTYLFFEDIVYTPFYRCADDLVSLLKNG